MSEPSLRIAEIYESLQGEGQLTGVTSIFLRTTGCNLRCSFCDTPFTSWRPEGSQQTLTKILDTIDSFSAQHVVITGGEPMLPAGIVPLTNSIKRMGKHITIETAGTIDRNVICDLISISPKLNNSTPSAYQGQKQLANDPIDKNRWANEQLASEWTRRHELRRLQPKVLNSLLARYDYQLKFVVDQPEDLEEIQQLLTQLKPIDPAKVWLMPQGVVLEELSARQVWLAPLCRKLGYQLCERKHIEWYGNRRGT